MAVGNTVKIWHRSQYCGVKWERVRCERAVKSEAFFVVALPRGGCVQHRMTPVFVGSSSSKGKCSKYFDICETDVPVSGADVNFQGKKHRSKARSCVGL